MPEPQPFREHDAFIDAHGIDAVVAATAPFLTNARKARIEQTLAARLGSVTIAVERPQDPHNAAAMVRSAEALGAAAVHVIGAEDGALNSRGTTQGAFHWIDTYHHRDLAGFLDELPRPPMRIFGATMGGELTPVSVPVDAPVCILLGNETDGLSEAALAVCDGTVRIPMHGMAESLNLSVSAAVLAYTVMQRRRDYLRMSGDLEEAEIRLRRARAYARSLEPRLLDGLFSP